MEFYAAYWAFLLQIYPCLCYNHWVVTEDGKIEHQVASPFNLRQPFDLMAFIAQEERVSILKELKEELIDYKNEFELFSEFESFDESYRALDPECRDVKLISSYDLYISTVLPLKHKGIDFHDHLVSLTSPPPAEPHCTMWPLPFSMAAMEHLEGVQTRRGLVSPPERSVLSAVEMRQEMFGSLVHHALEKNSTSWVLYNLATLYWRARGNANQAIECCRRALHYSPYPDRDLALLNLANVLHRSHHSQDAAVALRVAISHTPSVSVLYFSLGNVYAALEQLNNSVRCFQHCRELDPTCTMSRDMHLAALCELRMEQASKQRSEKLDDTQRKLDMFYSNMELVRKHQNLGGVAERAGHATGSGGGKGRGLKVTEGEGEGVDFTDATPVVSDSELDDGVELDDGMGLDSGEEEVDLEQELEQVLSKLDSDSDEAAPTNLSNNESSATEEQQQTRSNFRLVLKPLPPGGVASNSPTPALEQSNNEEGCGFCEQQCPSEAWVMFSHHLPHGASCLADTGSDVTGNDVTGSGGYVEDGVQYVANFDHELTIFDHIEQELIPDTKPKDPQTSPTPYKEYPLAYRSLEFMPYDPLPDYMEAGLFSRQHHTPLPVYNDPYWPRKRECLELVNELKNNPKVSSFMGSFITPEARGISLEALFSPVPLNFSHELKRRPDCGKVVDLPHSMLTMDHLEPIMYRANFRKIPQLGERNLRKVLIALASWDLNAELTFEESAERVHIAMHQTKPNWALFNIASLYWRVKGDPTHSIECLRRAVHFAPREARDVGYVGLANVLLRHGYLNEAVIMARASLDINEKSPVAHYTLAHVYLSLRDYLAANLHLRAALNTQPVFSYALISLKVVRCSLKLKEEQLFMRQKMKEEEQELLRKQEVEIMNKLKDVVKGKKMEPASQPAIVIENKEPPDIPEFKMGEMVESPFTGENAIRFLSRLSLGAGVKGQEEEEGGESEDVKVEGQEGVEGDNEGVKQDGQEVKGHETGDASEQLPAGIETEKEMVGGERGVAKPEASEDSISSKKLGQELSKKSTTSKKPIKSKAKKKPKKQPPKPVTPPTTLSDEEWEEHRARLYEEIERDTREAIIVAAEAINKNQTPVVQESKVYTMPGKRSSKTPPKTTPTLKTTPPGGKRLGDSDQSDNATPTANKATPTTSDTNNEKSKGGTTPTDRETTPTNTNEDPQSATPTEADEPPRPVGRARPPKHHKTRDEVREEELRRRFPGIKPWPSQEECDKKPLPKTVVFTSTWLSVTAKGVSVKEHLDFKSPVGPHMQLPYCHNDFEQSKKTLSHLTGMNAHPTQQYKAEKGLQEVLCTLDGLRRPLDEVATRVKLAMDVNSTSWVLSNLAALYWRIVGQGQLATKCLKHALYYSDDNARDVALVSLANVLYRSGFDIDAAVVIHMSLEASPTLVVNHFTMANILAAQGLFVEAAGFYESTLQFQPEFQPAADRLYTVRCLIMAAKRHKKKTKNKELE